MSQLNKQDILKNVHELTIRHPRFEKLYKMLDSLRPDRSLGDYKHKPRHLFILGESGVGKSTLVEEYTRANPGHVHTDEEGTEYDIRPVVYAEIPNPFTLVEFHQAIVRALGAPQFAKTSIGEVKRQAFTLLEKQKVEMLILDEVNYILESTRFIRNQEAMEAIKHLSNIGNVSIVLVGTPECKQLSQINFQYRRRFPTVELLRFEGCNEEFCRMLVNIENQIGLPLGLGNPDTDLPQLLHTISGGLLGALIPILETAYKSILDQYEGEELTNVENFIDALAQVSTPILGDDETDFIRRLEKSESLKK